jgi:sulfur relay (sulfurtransferase) DsrC/TusE family protein
MTTTTANPPAQQTQVPIPVPPRVITTKDLLYLKDAMSWELVAFKKFHFFAGQVTNPQIKQLLDKTGKMHQQHFQKLLTHLQVDNNAAMANLPRPAQTQQSSQ